MAKTQAQMPVGSVTWPVWRLGQALKRNSLSLIITFLLLWVVAAPIIMLITSSLREGNFITPGAFTLGNYRTVYLSAMTYPALVNTLIYAVAVSAISVIFAAGFAWVGEL